MGAGEEGREDCFVHFASGFGFGASWLLWAHDSRFRWRSDQYRYSNAAYARKANTARAAETGADDLLVSYMTLAPENALSLI